jgi:hypothetical protein
MYNGKNRILLLLMECSVCIFSSVLNPTIVSVIVCLTTYLSFKLEHHRPWHIQLSISAFSSANTCFFYSSVLLLVTFVCTIVNVLLMN